MKTRRNFIKQIGWLSFGLGPLLRAAQQEIILGHNGHRYKVDKTWGLLDPAVNPVKDCHEMSIDKKGHIYMFGNETRNNMLVYNQDGKLLNAWGNKFVGGHGCSIHDEGKQESLYLTDPDLHQWFKTDLKGNILQEWKTPMETGLYTKPEEFKPTETAIHPTTGDIYVADGYGKDYIFVYDNEGKLKFHFGGKGDKPEHIKNAHGVCLDFRNKKQPVVLVTSRPDNKLKIFTLKGEYLKTIDLPGAYICRPVIKGDYLYFAVLINHEPWTSGTGFVTILDKDFKVVSSPAALAPSYSDGVLQPYQEDPATKDVFIHPHDVLVDQDDNIIVTQWNSGKTYPIRLLRVA